MRSTLALVLMLVSAGCRDDTSGPADAGPTARRDAGPAADTSPPDGPDARGADAGGSPEAGAEPDASLRPDSGAPDDAAPDDAAPDGAAPDGAAPDIGVLDAAPDSGSMDAAPEADEGPLGDLGPLPDLDPDPQLACPADDRFEENDRIADAHFLRARDALSAIMCGRDDDYYSVAIEAGCRLTADLLFRHADGDLELKLYDAGGAELARSTSSDDDEHIVFQAPRQAVYYLRVELWAVHGGQVIYRLLADTSC